jgi:hypothetical protein
MDNDFSVIIVEGSDSCTVKKVDEEENPYLKYSKGFYDL